MRRSWASRRSCPCATAAGAPTFGSTATATCATWSPRVRMACAGRCPDFDRPALYHPLEGGLWTWAQGLAPDVVAEGLTLSPGGGPAAQAALFQRRHLCLLRRPPGPLRGLLRVAAPGDPRPPRGRGQRPRRAPPDPPPPERRRPGMGRPRADLDARRARPLGFAVLLYGHAVARGLADRRCGLLPRGGGAADAGPDALLLARRAAMAAPRARRPDPPPAGRGG